jgi:hypothetical protein
VSGGNALQIKVRRRAGGKGYRIVAIKPPIKGTWRRKEKCKKKKRTQYSKSGQIVKPTQSREIEDRQFVKILATWSVSSVLQSTVFLDVKQYNQLKTTGVSEQYIASIFCVERAKEESK